MKQASFGNFQVGMVDDPSVEDKGGFEFASGMDIFSEPGVMKASNAMEAVSLGAGVTLSALPTHLVRPPTSFGGIQFIAMNNKILRHQQGADVTEYITNGEGVIDGLASWNSFLFYSSAGSTDLGRVPESSSNPSADKDDTYRLLSGSMSYDNRSMLIQAGTLKIASYRYVDSLDESFVIRTQALKLPDTLQAATLANHFNSLFVGTRTPFNAALSTTRPNNASIFNWSGIPLSAGAALPTNIFPIEGFGAFSLVTGASLLYALIGDNYSLFYFDGATFRFLRRFSTPFISSLRPNNESACDFGNGILFAGNTDLAPGVFRVDGSAVCQAFVPSGITPGAAANIKVGFVKVGILGKVYMSYAKTVGATTTYHLEQESSNKQNGAFVATVWHRMKTDRNKRWAGVRLNLEPLASGCSVAVHYRTARNAAFTDTGYTVTSTNQHRPVLLNVRPRSRDIQFKFVYTTNGASTPELISYDPIFEVLNSMR